jgi:uncharacterized coiled-coil DUF342 family protein
MADRFTDLESQKHSDILDDMLTDADRVKAQAEDTQKELRRQEKDINELHEEVSEAQTGIGIANRKLAKIMEGRCCSKTTLIIAMCVVVFVLIIVAISL